ncbi:MAG TPA: LysM domain-containing protein [Phototrophicaceae bacterium]|nr:LysM domain-containing protein [Phototrophicaceae bacterium]
MRTRTLFRIIVLGFILAGSVWLIQPQAAQANCGVNHTVVAGQNLYRISLAYGVSMDAIAKANNIADVRRIYTGQVLFIPCAGNVVPGTTTGTTTITTTTTTTTVTTIVVTPTPSLIPTATPITGVNQPAGTCTGFRATSPTDGFVNGEQTFYWDAPKGTTITDYQVNILDANSRIVAGFSAPGSVTRTRGNVSLEAIGRGMDYAWSVVALYHGVETCRTQTVWLRREWSDGMGS